MDGVGRRSGRVSGIAGEREDSRGKYERDEGVHREGGNNYVTGFI
jgi:hypothetical protein